MEILTGSVTGSNSAERVGIRLCLAIDFREIVA